MKTYILIIIFLLNLFNGLSAHPKHEIRAVWITSLYNLDWPQTKATNARNAEKQRQELCKILDQLQEAQFNTVLFQTRLRGDVIYPSRYESFNECLTGTYGKNPGYDPLKFAIDECHKRGMELHAWIVAIPAGNLSLSRKYGNKTLARKHPELCKLYRRSWYLDPGNPDTKEYLAMITHEIVSRYDVDGIHLDYIRYPESARHFPDQAHYRKYGKGKELRQWRTENITGIVRRIYNEVKSVKPWIKVSSSPVGKYNDTAKYSAKGWNARNAVFQDAQLWMKEGIHDMLFPMMYFKDNNFFPFALDWNENKNERWVVPGLGIYFMDPKEGNWQLEDVMKQIYFIRQNGLDGQAYFRNKFLLNDTRGLFTEIKDKIYQYPAMIPPMKWMDSIPPAVPEKPLFEKREISIRLQWGLPTDTTTVCYRIYASGHYPVDISRAENIVSTHCTDNNFTYSKNDLIDGKKFWAVTAVDRFGNESGRLDLNKPLREWLNIYDNTFPKIGQNETLIIRSITGREIIKLAAEETDRLDELEKGFYRVQVIDNRGNHKELGTLVK